MIRALKARGIPTSGSDRLKVGGHIGVADLVSLGRFVLLPEDDLALAEALKSPLLELDDEDLFAISHGRKSSLWGALQKASEGDGARAGRLREVVILLRSLRNEADYRPPFEFFKRVLDRGDCLQRMLTRLGPEASDAIDAFLDLALAYEKEAPPSLQGFLDWFERADPEIRRDMDKSHGEVRVMTVHGAKGLEAPIVFLPDTFSAPTSRSPELLPLGDGEPFIWPASRGRGLAAVEAAKSRARDLAQREHNRLLYVAMTRARDRLYIAGFHGARAPAEGCWYALIEQALRPFAISTNDSDGLNVLRLESAQTAEVKTGRGKVEQARSIVPLPSWARKQAPRAVARAVPLAPSRLAPLISDEGSGFAPPVDAAFPPFDANVGDSLHRGRLIHRLLQHLPSVGPFDRRRVGLRILEMQAPELSKAAHSLLVEEVMAVIEAPEHAPLFGPRSLAEVYTVAEISLQCGGPLLRISGQIDRLIVENRVVRFLDFKTNRIPPSNPEDIPETYLLQLAAYRMALRQIYKASDVEAGLLWTTVARLMPIEHTRLDDHEKAILAGRPWA
jgi:ATP-dependent helicase/nuclease subunit A